MPSPAPACTAWLAAAAPGLVPPAPRSSMDVMPTTLLAVAATFPPSPLLPLVAPMAAVRERPDPGPCGASGARRACPRPPAWPAHALAGLVGTKLLSRLTSAREEGWGWPAGAWPPPPAGTAWPQPGACAGRPLASARAAVAAADEGREAVRHRARCLPGEAGTADAAFKGRVAPFAGAPVDPGSRDTSEVRRERDHRPATAAVARAAALVRSELDVAPAGQRGLGDVGGVGDSAAEAEAEVQPWALLEAASELDLDPPPPLAPLLALLTKPLSFPAAVASPKAMFQLLLPLALCDRLLVRRRPSMPMLPITLDTTAACCSKDGPCPCGSVRLGRAWLREEGVPQVAQLPRSE